MNINLPPRVRQAIYILATVVSPVMAYLAQNGTVTEFQAGLYLVALAGVTALAGYNTNVEEK